MASNDLLSARTLAQTFMKWYIDVMLQKNSHTTDVENALKYKRSISHHIATVDIRHEMTAIIRRRPLCRLYTVPRR